MIPIRDTRLNHHFPVMNALLITLNVIVFYLVFTHPSLDQFIARYALIPERVDFRSAPSFLPLLTALFLHGGFLHIFSNMLYLWVFGDNIEQRFGWFYLPFYLIGGIVANFIQFLAIRDATIPVVGASGAVAAVLGAYLVLFPSHRILTVVPLLFIFLAEIRAPILLAIWFLIQFYQGYIAIGDPVDAGGIAYMAHIGGFAFGILFALGYLIKQRLNSRSL